MKLDLNKIFSNSLKELETNKTLELKIQEKFIKVVENTILESIDDYETKQIIEKVIQQEIHNTLPNLKINGFSNLLLDTFGEFFSQHIAKEKVEEIKDKYKKTFFQPMDNCKVSEILNAYKEHITPSEDDCRCDPPEYSEFNIDFKTKTDNGFTWIDFYLYTQNSKSSYNTKENEFKFKLHKYKDEPFKIVIFTFDGETINSSVIKIGYVDNFQQLLTSLIYNKTPIELDYDENNIDEYDTSLDLPEY